MKLRVQSLSTSIYDLNQQGFIVGINLVVYTYFEYPCFVFVLYTIQELQEPDTLNVQEKPEN